MRGKNNGVVKIGRMSHCPSTQKRKEVEKKRMFSERTVMQRGFKNKEEVIVWVHE